MKRIFNTSIDMVKVSSNRDGNADVFASNQDRYDQEGARGRSLFDSSERKVIWGFPGEGD